MRRGPESVVSVSRNVCERFVCLCPLSRFGMDCTATTGKTPRVESSHSFGASFSLTSLLLLLLTDYSSLYFTVVLLLHLYCRLLLLSFPLLSCSSYFSPVSPF